KQVALSLHNCNDTYKRLPPLTGYFPPPSASQQTATTSRGSIFFWLLPFNEQDNVFKLGIPPNAPANAQTWAFTTVTAPNLANPVRTQVIPPYLAPSDFTNSSGAL